LTNATRVTVTTFGTLAGLAGIEHGIGEVLQGNAAPSGVMILSWPESGVFDLLSGEPAMTIVPNLLVSGILAILVSLVFLVWAIMFVQRRNGGLILILLSAVMLLVGGGFGPPILGIIVGTAATRIDAPPVWWRTHLPGGSLSILAKMWPWLLVASVIAWLSVLPGTVLLEYFFGVSDLDIIVPILEFNILCAFGLLLLTIFTGFAYDVQSKADLRRGRLILR
jgi:hypothetical protein